VSAVTELVDRQQDVLAKDIELGRIVLAVTRAASEFGVRIPGDLSMLGKTLLNLDRVGRVLDPEFDPNAAIRTQVADILRQRMWKKVAPGAERFHSGTSGKAQPHAGSARGESDPARGRRLR
jgi:predicted unusual protein kinase regulating ubiquinone biosynthesis (AarF/ABC1/UbiB family)